MTACEYCQEEIEKDDDFILVGKYPSGLEKWGENLFPSSNPMLRLSSPEDFGTIYHMSCFLEKIKKEDVKEIGLQDPETSLNDVCDFCREAKAVKTLKMQDGDKVMLCQQCYEEEIKKREQNLQAKKG